MHDTEIVWREDSYNFCPHPITLKSLHAHVIVQNSVDQANYWIGFWNLYLISRNIHQWFFSMLEVQNPVSTECSADEGENSTDTSLII